MSDYISKSALEKELVDDFCADCTMCGGHCRHDDLFKIIDNQPTVDENDIIRKRMELIIDRIEKARQYDSEDEAIGNWNTRIDIWIPCSERLPKKTAHYLVTTDNHTISMYAWWKRSEKRWFYFNSTVEMFDVIAWKPIPKPYKKEGAE